MVSSFGSGQGKGGLAPRRGGTAAQCGQRVDAGAAQHGEGDQRDFPQLHLVQQAGLAQTVAAGADGAKADGQAIDGTDFHQLGGLAPGGAGQGQLALSSAAGREAAELVKIGAVDGLSIGFRTIRASRDRLRKARLLHEVELWEISLVTFPMLRSARIHPLPALRRRSASTRRKPALALS